MPHLRIAAIEFLNAAPLMRGLDADPRFSLSFTLPSVCAARLGSGDADLGVIPVIELGRIPGLVGLAGLGVAARAQVRSILLVSRCPAAAIQRVALDRASRTSAALVQILLRERFQARFEVVQDIEGAPDWRRTLLERGHAHDALLMIGDPALRVAVSGEAEAAGLRVYDLAREWHGWTGLPSVFAVWGVRRAAYEANAGWLADRLRQSLRDGVAAREALVAEWAPRLRLPPAEIRRYLHSDVEYELGPEHLAGLRLYVARAAALGLLPPQTDGARFPELLSSST